MNYTPEPPHGRPVQSDPYFTLMQEALVHSQNPCTKNTNFGG